MASLFKATGKPYRSTTGNPAYVNHRLRSPLWKLVRKPQIARRNRTLNRNCPNLARAVATNRLTSPFEYVGPANAEDARRFGIL